MAWKKAIYTVIYKVTGIKLKNVKVTSGVKKSLKHHSPKQRSHEGWCCTTKKDSLNTWWFYANYNIETIHLFPQEVGRTLAKNYLNTS